MTVTCLSCFYGHKVHLYAQEKIVNGVFQELLEGFETIHTVIILDLKMKFEPKLLGRSHRSSLERRKSVFMAQYCSKLPARSVAEGTGEMPHESSLTTMYLARPQC